MIDRDEIDEKAAEYEIHTTNVQRDYVFGWMLCAIYNNPYLAELLILKGGNCFRKVYFPNTRFSNDLDFATQSAIQAERLASELNECCRFAQDRAGVVFETDKTRVEEDRVIDKETTVWKVRLYFKDFYGEESKITISVRLDITEFDRLLLPVQTRPLMHPYTDAGECAVSVRCLALEELIAIKMKCLLQRRHSYDLYDLVYAVLFEHDVELDRLQVVRTFLQKTIFSRSPGSAKQILLGLPMVSFRTTWEKYIVCPVRSWIDFDLAVERYTSLIAELFELVGGRVEPSLAFFPPELRNPIMEAGAHKRLIRLRYHGFERTVEPYSLAYKRRKDGVAQEYFYGWDRVGGRTKKPGIRAFLNPDIEDLEVLEGTFKPRFEIELAKAGETPKKGYFQKSFGSSRPRGVSPRRGTGRSRRTVSAFGRGGMTYVIQCPFCAKRFNRKTNSTKLNKHKTPGGWDCSARTGFLVDQRWS